MPCFTDLERKISLRVTREELIRKGVLKEVDTDGQDVRVDGLGTYHCINVLGWH